MCIIIVVLLILLMPHCLFKFVSLNMCLKCLIFVLGYNIHILYDWVSGWNSLNHFHVKLASAMFHLMRERIFDFQCNVII